MRNNLKKILKYGKRTGAILSTAVALSFSSPGEVEAQRSFPCNAPQEYCDAILNPFGAINDSTLDFHGSGDADENNKLDQKDIDAMVAGADNYRADVNGDGIVDEQDQILLAKYLNGDIEYLPGMWNHLQTTEERASWNDAIELYVDQRDTITWTFPDKISKFFAALGFFFGSSLPDTTNMPEVYKQHFKLFGRYNKPTYFVNVQFGGGIGHGMNAILTGDDPLKYGHWRFTEPQNDSLDVQPGTGNIPYGSRVEMHGIQRFLPPGGFDLLPLVWFDVDSNGI